jgi:hypothetical protein
LSRPVLARKIFSYACRAKHLYKLVPFRTHKRGVSRSSRTLGAGCGGRESIRRSLCARRLMYLRTAKSCGLGIPTLMLSWRNDPSATVAKKPGHRREHGISVKTIVQGMPDCSGEPVVTTLVCFITCAREAAGANCAPAFPAPSFFEGHYWHSSGAI